jgi:hypothetical protein
MFSSTTVAGGYKYKYGEPASSLSSAIPLSYTSMKLLRPTIPGPQKVVASGTKDVQRWSWVKAMMQTHAVVASIEECNLRAQAMLVGNARLLPSMQSANDSATESDYGD